LESAGIPQASGGIFPTMRPGGRDAGIIDLSTQASSFIAALVVASL